MDSYKYVFFIFLIAHTHILRMASEFFVNAFVFWLNCFGMANAFLNYICATHDEKKIILLTQKKWRYLSSSLLFDLFILSLVALASHRLNFFLFEPDCWGRFINLQTIQSSLDLKKNCKASVNKTSIRFL